MFITIYVIIYCNIFGFRQNSLYPQNVNVELPATHKERSSTEQTATHACEIVQVPNTSFAELASDVLDCLLDRGEELLQVLDATTVF